MCTKSKDTSCPRHHVLPASSFLLPASSIRHPLVSKNVLMRVVLVQFGPHNSLFFDNSLCFQPGEYRAISLWGYSLCSSFLDTRLPPCVAVCCGALQCVAVCCSVVQCGAVCCSVLQYDAVRCRVLQCVAVCCAVFYSASSNTRLSPCVAVCCSVLRCVAVCCSVLQCVAVCRSVLQCAAVCCSVLQCAAVCCSVLHCPLQYVPFDPHLPV